MDEYEFKATKQEDAELRIKEFGESFNYMENYKGFTALHYSALLDNEDICKQLIENGADPRIKNFYGHFPDKYTNNQKLIKLFKQRRTELNNEEKKNFPLKQRLQSVIIGQRNAIDSVVSVIKRKESGWFDEEHPLVLMFVGSSGTGKTETAKQIAKYLKSESQNFIRIDMSEYQTQHEVAKFIGSPPGYVGHENGGQLTDALSKNPESIVLFDEIEKAHPDVLTILLQLFDEGRLTDGKGKSVDCRGSIFIMTSNLASNEIAQYGVNLRNKTENDYTKIHLLNSKKKLVKEDEGVSKQFKDEVIKPILKRHFRRNEFLGRINEFIFFLPFNQKELEELAEKELNFWKRKARNFDLDLNWSKRVLKVLIREYDVNYGARSIKHEIEKRIIGKLAEVDDINSKKHKKIEIGADDFNKIFLTFTKK